MCTSISLVSRPIKRGESWVYFINPDGRQTANPYENDSHTNIARIAAKECSFLRAVYNKVKAWKRPDGLINKWEWNPFKNALTKDRINCRINDYTVMLDFVKTLKPEEVIGTKIRLAHYGYFGTYGVQFLKGKTWVTLNSLYVPYDTVPAKLRANRSVKATAYRKRNGGWGLKDFN